MVPSRRRFLATAGVAVGLPAGCLEDTERPYAPRVVALRSRNFHDEPHRFELTVRHDGDRVHASSHDLDAAEGRTWTEDRVDGPWGDGPGALEVDVVLDGTEEYTHRYADTRQERFAVGPTVATDGSYGDWIAIGESCRD